MKCPICNKGTIVEKKNIVPVMHNNIIGSIDFLYVECDSCGEIRTAPDQAKANKAQLINFRKKTEI